MPAFRVSIGSPPRVVGSRAISRTLWDSAGKCIFLYEKGTWRLAPPPPTPIIGMEPGPLTLQSQCPLKLLSSPWLVWLSD